MIAQRLIKPADCVIGACIPTTRREFVRDIDDPAKEFVPKLCPVWFKYEEEVVHPFERVRGPLTAWGVQVVPGVTLKSFGELFRLRRSVVILFAHWSDDRVEFADGLKPIDRVIEAVPEEFGGILDLCVCHPEALATGMRVRRPNCLVKRTVRQAVPKVWLYFYLALFGYLKDTDDFYMAALEAVTKEFLAA